MLQQKKSHKFKVGKSNSDGVSEIQERDDLQQCTQTFKGWKQIYDLKFLSFDDARD